jgi:ketosteroid isomerase-like protein
LRILENKALVARYFEAVNGGDMDAINDILDDSVTFWVPPSLPDGALFEGKEQVLALFASSVGLYDVEAGLTVSVGCMTAEEDRVAVELVIEGRAAANGQVYRNHYHFLIRVGGGHIVSIREHLDSHYAYTTLFEPAGIRNREDCDWLPGSGA